MRHWDRCSRTGDFFYAVMVIAAFVVMRFSFFADMVVYASSFGHAEPALRLLTTMRAGKTAK